MLLIFFVFFLISIVVTSDFRIKINRLYFTSEERKWDYDVLIEFIILRKIKVFKFNIHKNYINILRNKSNEKEIGLNIFRFINLLEKNAKSLNFNVNIGVLNNTLTTYGTVIIAIVISNLFRGRNTKYTVNPIYNKENRIIISINCIAIIKFVHIIYAIFIILKERRKKDGRRKFKKAPNRRAYDYSHE